MRILQVSSAEEYGGGERHVSDLVRALSERGHELHVAVRARSPLPAVLDDTRSIIWHHLPLRSAIDLQSVFLLARLIREQNIDLVHAHVARDYPVCSLAAKSTRTPFVLTRHHFNPLKGGRLYSWTFGDLSRIIAVSKSVAATLNHALPHGLESRIVVIPNWINLSESAPGDREAAREALLITRPLAIAIVGKITPLKGHSIFVEMAARLVNENGHRDIEFIIAGEAEPGDSAYEHVLKHLVDAAGLSSYVRFVGFIPRISRLFSAFDVVVAPSEDEAFSLVVTEAMASCCAVVAADRGGISELIQDGVSGVLVRSLDADSFARAVNMLVRDPQLRSKLGDAARRSVSSRFARDTMIDQIEAIYRSLVSARHCLK